MQPMSVARVLRPLAAGHVPGTSRVDLASNHRLAVVSGSEHVASEDVASALAQRGSLDAAVWLRLESLDAEPRCLMESLARAATYAGSTVIKPPWPNGSGPRSGTHRQVGQWLADVLDPSTFVVLEDERPSATATAAVETLVAYLGASGGQAHAVYLCHGPLPRNLGVRTTPVVDGKHLLDSIEMPLGAEAATDLTSLERLSSLVDHRSAIINDVVDATALRDHTLLAHLSGRSTRRRSLLQRINSRLIPHLAPAEIQALEIATRTGYWHHSLSDRMPPEEMTLRPWMVPLEHDWWWLRPMWRPSLTQLLGPRRTARDIVAGLRPTFRSMYRSTEQPVVVPGRTAKPEPSASKRPVPSRNALAARRVHVAPVGASVVTGHEHAVPAVAATCELRAKMFGVFELDIDGTSVPRWRGRLGRSILAYLFLQQQCVARDRLLDVFWPDADPKAAQNRLRVAVSSLRRSLESASDRQVIEFVDGNYRVARGCEVTLDVDDFERHAKAGRRAESLRETGSALREYRRAIDEYRGDLLAELPYEEWTLLPREALRVAYIECLGNAASLHLQRGDHSEALDLAWRILGADPAREDAHRLIMHCHVAVGDVIQARRQFDLCCHELATILGVEPTSSTVELIRSIECPT